MIPLLLGLWLLAAGAADGENWVCVVAADGSGWECGRGDHAPEQRALPAPEPAIAPDPGAPAPRAQPAPDQLEPRATPAGRPTIFAPERLTGTGQSHSADEEGPALADGYALQIASLSSSENLRAFAENFEIDPGEVRQVRSADGRMLLLYGSYDDSGAARAARRDLPPILKALRPRVRRLDRLAGRPEPIIDPVAATQQPEEATTVDVVRPEDTAKLDPAAATPEPARVARTPVARTAAKPAPEQAMETAPHAESEAPPPTSQREPPTRPWQGRRAFRAAPGAYTIQLANLPDEVAATVFVRTHGLGGDLYLLPDPAAGRRLLLLGRFKSLADAEAELARLPPTLVAPWVRRASPLADAIAR